VVGKFATLIWANSWLRQCVRAVRTYNWTEDRGLPKKSKLEIATLT
jgi:hypothetical protein